METHDVMDTVQSADAAIDDYRDLVRLVAMDGVVTGEEARRLAHAERVMDERRRRARGRVAVALDVVGIARTALGTLRVTPWVARKAREAGTDQEYLMGPEAA